MFKNINNVISTKLHLKEGHNKKKPAYKSFPFITGLGVKWQGIIPRIFLIMLLSLFLFSRPVLFGESYFFIEKDTFLPGENTETIITIEKRGWYSIRVKGIIASSLTIIDRMSGSLGSIQKAEGEDGRIDLLLEKGEYKIRLKPDTPKTKAKASTLSLQVMAFKEKNIQKDEQSFPGIQDLDFLKDTLSDMETRSYWIVVEEGEDIFIEIAGRCLTSVSLWKDGYWKESVYVQQRNIEPESGKPLNYYYINTTLAAGNYLLQCVGGKKAEWPEEEEKNPFYIRRGLLYLGAENYSELTISPFGRDNYLVSGKTTFFQLMQDDLTPITLTVDSGNAYINKDSKNPWCWTTRYSQQKNHTLSITGSPGQRVRLLFFNNRDSLSFSEKERGNRYFFSGFRSIEGKNNIDLTPFYLFYQNQNYKIPKHNLVNIAKGNAYYRKINLLAKTQVFFAVKTKGTYHIKEFGTGAEAEYRFVLIDDPDSQYYAKYKKSGESVELINSYYMVDIKPIHAGILHFVIYHKDDEHNIAGIETSRPDEPRNHFLWPDVRVTNDEGSHYINLNRENGIHSAIIKRDLPLSLSSPLPLYLSGGETITLAFFTESESLLSVQGTDYEIKLNNRREENNTLLKKGTHTIAFTNKKTTGAYFSIHTKEPLKRVLLPPLYIKDPRDVYQVLLADKPLFVDFNRRDTKQYLLVVSKPTLYRIETSGRLATKITIRAPLKTDLTSVQQNGIGRNALIQTYLKEGNYLVEVETLGQSMGRCGIHLNTTIVTDGGIIRDNSISRDTVQKDHAKKYSVIVHDPGTYTIETIGYQLSIPYRFEEDGGWPLILNSSSRFNGYLTQGTYHYYSLPLDFRTRRVTSMVCTDSVVKNEQEVILNQPKKGTWYEKPGRPPDIYSLVLAAGMKITPVISRGMEGRMIHLKSNLHIDFSYKDSVAVEGEAGEYTIEITSIEENNDVSYSFTIKTDQLGPGLSKKITHFPAKIEIRNSSLNSGGNNDHTSGRNSGMDIIKIWSYGKTDTKASLWNKDNSVLLAENDDMEHDWNFEILQKLGTGSYLLNIEKQGKGSYYDTMVFMDRIEQQNLTKKNLPLIEKVNIGEKTILKIPFYTKSKTGLIVIRCKAPVTVAGTLYQADKKCADFQNELIIPLQPDKEYELFLSHMEQKDVSVTLILEPVALTDYELGEKNHITIVKPVKLINPNSLSFTISGDRQGILYSPGYEIPARQVTSYPYNVVNKSGWLINTNEDKSKEIFIEPVVIHKPTSLSFPFDWTEHSFSLSYYQSAVLLLEARLPGKKTGLSVVHEKDYHPGLYDWQGIGLEDERTLFGIPEKGEFRGRLWIAEDYRTQGLPLSCAFSITPFMLQNKETLSYPHEKTVVLEPGKGYTILFKETQQLVQLLLSKGLVAFHWYKHKPQQLFNAAKVNQKLSIPIRGGSISIVNTTRKNQLFRIIISGDNSVFNIQPKVTDRIMYEKVFDKAGTEHINIEAKNNDMLICAAGNISHIILKAENGKLYYGEEDSLFPGLRFFPGKSGIIEISHHSGSVFIWQSKKSNIFSHLLKKAGTLSSEELKTSASLGEKPRLFRITVKTPCFLHASSDLPGTLALLKNKKVLSVRLSSSEEGTTLFYNVNPGSYTLFVNPLNEEMRKGTLRFFALVPEKLVENGQEKSFFIGPQEYQAFTFSVEKEGLVGIGIKGESDGLSGILYDPAFTTIEQGPLIFHTLIPGDYYYLVFSKGTAVQYSPILLGTGGSQVDIPYDIIKGYR